MNEIVTAVSHNQCFLIALVAWIVSQSIKVCSGIIRERRFDFRWLLVTGGMPSTHAAGVAALSAAVGRIYGFDSVFFAIASVFTMIILFDAQGVRRSAGLQARVLNRIMEDIYFNRGIKEDRVKELLGHTPIQVFAGMVIGIAIAYAWPLQNLSS